MRLSLILLGACCLAFVGFGAAHNGDSHNLYGMVGKWQGTCVKKGYNHGCADDIISYPYYVEYAWDHQYNKYYTQYRKDAICITPWAYHGSDECQYREQSYHDKGWCQVSKNWDGYCVEVEFDDTTKRTYRTKVKREGDLDVMIEEGEMDLNYEFQGTEWGKCPKKSWQALKCDSRKHTYTYRCYLIRTSGWTWSW